MTISINPQSPAQVSPQDLASGQGTAGAPATAAATGAGASQDAPATEDQIAAHAGLVAQASQTLQAGAGVNSDLDGEGARLLALQVRQQLGGQTLSIANQAPQALLSLLR